MRYGVRKKAGKRVRKSERMGESVKGSQVSEEVRKGMEQGRGRKKKEEMEQGARVGEERDNDLAPASSNAEEREGRRMGGTMTLPRHQVMQKKGREEEREGQ